MPTWITGAQGDGSAKSTGAKAYGQTQGLTNGTSSATSGGERRRSMSTRTDENHEIAWPRNKDGAIDEEPEPESSSAVIDSTAPISKTSTGNPSAANDEDAEQFVSAGGSCIINPFGKTLVGPVWEKEHELLYTEVDFDDCERGHLDFDAVGHYSRPDAFKLSVEGLDLNPPP